MELKRVFDIATAASLAVLTAPILAGAALVTACSLRENPIYSQRRVGLDGQEFTLYKLKSMQELFDAKGAALPDSERITRIGKILRASKIDELPQLYNVLAGDMSIVGPRPAPIYMSVLAGDTLRHSVRPGLTGLAQLQCQGLLSDEEILKHDHAYVAHNSLLNDCAIALKTPYIIMKNINAPTFRATGQSCNLK